MNKLQLIITFCFVVLLWSCDTAKVTKIKVSNTANIQREHQTIYVDLAKAGLKKSSFYKVTNSNDDKVILSQMLDTNGDNKADKLIFQSTFKPNQTLSFDITEVKQNKDNSKIRTYARFEPRRIDDFAWENNKVAFRVYGPKAQKLNEAGDKEGITSSGIDCWCKSVDYPILTKWYDDAFNKKISYHEDNGEGLDLYHVGPSRGCGGRAIWLNDSLYCSKNYTDYKILSNGPIESRFMFNYEDYTADTKSIKEQAIYYIDLNSNLTDFSVSYKGVDTVTVGLSLHNLDGKISISDNHRWFNYNEPVKNNTILNSAIVIDPKYYAGHKIVKSEVKDVSHILVFLKVIDGKIEYKSGFFWSKSNHFKSQQDWEDYLKNESLRSENPLNIEYK